MKKEQRADALLDSARFWQNNKGAYGRAWTTGRKLWLSLADCPTDYSVADLASSAALSEVAGMSFDLQNADGTDCEKYYDAEYLRRGDRARCEAALVYRLRKVPK